MSNLLLLAVIPLTAGIFEQSRGIMVLEVEVAERVLFSVADQMNTFSAGFSFLAYNYEWLNGTHPAFVDQDLRFATLPSAVTDRGLNVSNETWVMESILYEADLNCEEGIVARSVTWFGVSNGHDCAYNVFAGPQASMSTFSAPRWDGLFRYEFNSPWNTWFMGQYNNGTDDTFSLSSGLRNCSNKYTILALWGKGQQRDGNITALFCEPSYWSQPARTTV